MDEKKIFIPTGRAIGKSTTFNPNYEQRLNARRVAPTFMRYLGRWQLARYWASEEGQRKKLHMQMSVDNPRLALQVYGHLLVPEKKHG
jgi:hypothetical protein